MGSRRRLATRVVGGVAGIGALVLVVWGVVLVPGSNDPEGVAAQSAYEAPSAHADVRCDEERTSILTRTVLTQGNGVRIRVDNRGQEEIWLDYELDRGSNGGGAELVPPGRSALFVLAPERSLGVACTTDVNGVLEHATLTVVRPLEVVASRRGDLREDDDDKRRK